MYPTISFSETDPSVSAFKCYQAIASGEFALESCSPSATKLLDAVADYVSARASGSSAETWIRLGTHLRDVLSGTNGVSAISCRSPNLSGAWMPALAFADTAIRTGARLLSDTASVGLATPVAGTHGSLSLAKTLLHPCALAPLSPAQKQSLARTRHTASGNAHGATSSAEDLIRSSTVARERGDCNASVSLAHRAADAAPDWVQAWYNLQVTSSVQG
jgi:hypothetical protein